jgi:hypothetical protein
MKNIFCLFLLSMLLPLFAEERSVVLVEENFDVADDRGLPKDWNPSHPEYLKSQKVIMEMKRIEDPSTPLTCLHIEKADGEGGASLGNKVVEIPPGTTFLRIKARMRGFDVSKGSDWWHLPGIGVTYHISESDAKPGMMNKWILLPEGKSLWKTYETEIPVRDHAPKASVGFISQGWAGKMDVDWIKIEAVKVIEPLP